MSFVEFNHFYSKIFQPFHLCAVLFRFDAVIHSKFYPDIHCRPTRKLNNIERVRRERARACVCERESEGGREKKNPTSHSYIYVINLKEDRKKSTK